MRLNRLTDIRIDLRFPEVIFYAYAALLSRNSDVVYVYAEKDDDYFKNVVEMALCVIKKFDFRLYKYVEGKVNCITITRRSLEFSSVAMFWGIIFFNRDDMNSSSPSEYGVRLEGLVEDIYAVAVSIVHESTHIRINNFGIRYVKCEKIERICDLIGERFSDKIDMDFIYLIASGYIGNNSEKMN